MKLLTPASAALVLAWSLAAAAQTAPAVAGYQVPGGGAQLPAQGVQIIGYDSATGSPCVVGQTATCLLAVSGGSGGGGGAITAAPGAFASGAYASGSIASGAVVDIGAAGSTACATDTGSCNLNSLLQRALQRDTAILTAIGTPFQAGGSIGNTSFASTESGAWNVGGLTGVGQNNAITRIANTTTYTTNQLVCLFSSATPCAPIQVTIAGANAATGTFGRVWLGKTGTSLTSATFTSWFFSAAPTTTSMFDHTAYVGPFAADLPNFLGSFTCNAMQATNDATAQAFSECTPNTPSGWIQYQALAGQKYVDALITATGAYTPTSGEVFTIFANSMQDK